MQATQVQMQESIQEILYELRCNPINYRSSGRAELGTVNSLSNHVPEGRRHSSFSNIDRLLFLNHV